MPWLDLRAVLVEDYQLLWKDHWIDPIPPLLGIRHLWLPRVSGLGILQWDRLTKNLRKTSPFWLGIKKLKNLIPSKTSRHKQEEIRIILECQVCHLMISLFNNKKIMHSKIILNHLSICLIQISTYSIGLCSSQVIRPWLKAIRIISQCIDQLEHLEPFKRILQTSKFKLLLTKKQLITIQKTHLLIKVRISC